MKLSCFNLLTQKHGLFVLPLYRYFIPEKENLIIGTLFLVIMSTIINLPSISMWAFGGSVIRRII